MHETTFSPNKLGMDEKAALIMHAGKKQRIVKTKKQKHVLPQCGICFGLFKWISRRMESNQAITYWPPEIADSGL